MGTRPLTEKEQRQVDDICETVDQRYASWPRQPKADRQVQETAPMIWALIRYALIIGSAALLIFILYVINTEQVNNWPAVLAIAGGLALNLIYLLFGCRSATRPARRPASRLGRLIALWFDAKETELRKRAGKS